jgi:hypothetical protein
MQPTVSGLPRCSESFDPGMPTQGKNDYMAQRCGNVTYQIHPSSITG